MTVLKLQLCIFFIVSRNCYFQFHFITSKIIFHVLWTHIHCLELDQMLIVRSRELSEATGEVPWLW